MKYLFFSFLAVAFIACTGSDKHGTSSVHGHSNDSMAQEALKDTASYTTIEWVDSVHTDLGKISEGQSIEISWQFKNTGTLPGAVELCFDDSIFARRHRLLGFFRNSTSATSRYVLNDKRFGAGIFKLPADLDRLAF